MQPVVVLNNAFEGRETVVTIGDDKFRVTVERYESIGGFAEVLVTDLLTHERYQSTGQIQIRGHTIITKWGREYDSVRDNYLCTRDLNIIAF